MYGMRREDVTGLRGGTLPELKRARAKERRAATQFGSGGGKFPQPSTGKSRDKAAVGTGALEPTGSIPENEVQARAMPAPRQNLAPAVGEFRGKSVLQCSHCSNLFVSGGGGIRIFRGAPTCTRCYRKTVAAESERARNKDSGH